MPEAKSTSSKSTTNKRTTSSAQAEAKTKATKVTVKSASTKPKASSVKATAKSTQGKATQKTSAKSKSSPKLADVKPAKKSAGTKSADAKTSNKKSPSAKAKSAPAQKSTVKNPTATKKPTAKKSGKAIDSFVIPADRSKTTAGNTDMDWKDLEQRVDDYESDAEPKAKKAKKSAKAASLKLKNLDSKPRKVFRIIGAVLSLVLLISSAVLGAMVVIINLLPSIYLIPALAVLAIIAVSFSIIMVHHKVNPAIKAPFFLLSIIFSAVYIFGITYLDKTFNFFDNLKGQDYLTESYYVVVEKDSDYKDIHDLRGKTIATYDEGVEIYQEAIKKLQALVKVELTTMRSQTSSM